MREQLAEENSVEALAGLVELSPFHFSRVFKQATGMSPLQFVTRERIARAQQHSMPILPARTTQRDPAWRDVLASLLSTSLPPGQERQLPPPKQFSCSSPCEKPCP